MNIESGLSEESLPAFDLKRYYRAQDGGYGRGAHLAVLCLILLVIVVDMIEHCLEVFGIDKQQSVVVRDLKDDRENIGLKFIEFENTRKKERSHLRDRRAELYALLSVNIPESDGISLIAESVFGKAESLYARAHILTVGSGSHQSRDVTLDVGQKYGNAHITECLCQHFQRDSLAGSGRAGDQSVPVRFAG